MIPEEQRVMPVTIAHDVVAEHPFMCGCSACSTYPVELRRRLKRSRLTS